jgi:uroporphyrinogen III methyltransferase/synthase
MGVAHRDVVAARLLRGGLAPDTPVLAARWGSRPDQSSVRVRLDELGATPLEPPVTLVIGAVAGLELNWFERRPLFGRQVVVTRARTQASGLSGRLRALGAFPVEVPTIRIDPPADGGLELDRAAAGLAEGAYDWVVFSSANAVDALLERLPDLRSLGAVRIATIGPGTSRALADWHLSSDLEPPRSVSESLLEVFPDPPQRPGRSVLLPRAAEGRRTLADGLAGAGWTVDPVEAYRTVPVLLSEADRAAVAGSDAICFASASAVNGFVESAGGARCLPPVVVCIGPTTEAAARAAGVEVTAVAGQHTLDGLVEALVLALATRPG